MAGSLIHLAPTPGSMLEGEHEVFGSEHPMREVTREIAFGGEWTADMRARVAGLFDDLADQWDGMRTADRYDTLDDALARGDVGDGRCVELGSGTGLGTARLAPRSDRSWPSISRRACCAMHPRSSRTVCRATRRSSRCAAVRSMCWCSSTCSSSRPRSTVHVVRAATGSTLISR